MYTVAVKDHIMIAHGLTGETFGPAQKLHGATYVISAEWSSRTLTSDDIVLDIGRATEALAETLSPLRYQNLDDLPLFKGKNTTTEFLAHHIHQDLAKTLKDEFSGSLRVVLEESHVAWAAFEGPV